MQSYPISSKGKVVDEKAGGGNIIVDSQNVNAPAMIPLATATGKIMYASCVKGNCKTMKSGGGMTSLSLALFTIKFRSTQLKRIKGISPVHGQEMMNPMRQEMQHQENWSVRQHLIHVEQKPVQ